MHTYHILELPLTGWHKTVMGKQRHRRENWNVGVLRAPEFRTTLALTLAIQCQWGKELGTYTHRAMHSQLGEVLVEDTHNIMGRVILLLSVERLAVTSCCPGCGCSRSG